MKYIAIAFFCTFITILILIKTRLANIALDRPNHRSLHHTVTPRTGGLAIMFSVLFVLYTMSGFNLWLYLCITLIVVSLIDDMHGLGVKWRFMSQFVVCTVFVNLFIPNFSVLMLIGLIIFMVWVTNLYNFMDGSDGLAGGMTLFGFATYSIAANLGNDIQLALICGSIAVASLAFLIFNFYPAKIFMGDSGSVPLGFLAGAVGLYGWQNGLWQFWFPILVFSPFIIDATVTLLKRLVHGEKIWLPHRSHYYQRLVQMGWGHRNTAIAEYFLMFMVCGSAIMMLKCTIISVLIILLFWSFSYFILMRLIDNCWKKHQMHDSNF